MFIYTTGAGAKSMCMPVMSFCLPSASNPLVIMSLLIFWKIIENSIRVVAGTS